MPIQSIVRGLGPSNPKNPRLKNRGLRVGKPSDMHFFYSNQSKYYLNQYNSERLKYKSTKPGDSIMGYFVSNQKLRFLVPPNINFSALWSRRVILVTCSLH